jgi:hypothetical protein
MATPVAEAAYVANAETCERREPRKLTLATHGVYRAHLGQGISA